MESIELTSVPNGKPTASRYQTSCSRLTGKLNKIFYTNAVLICALEAIVIALFLVYLGISTNPEQIEVPNSPADVLPGPSSAPAQFRNFSSNGKYVLVLPGLVENCNQRKHDINHASKCMSRSTEKCEKIQGDTGPPINAGWALRVTTSKNGDRMSSQQIRIEKSCPVKEACKFKTRLTVSRSKRQTIIGWGGALTDSSINNILSLSTNGTRNLLADYFGPDGLKFNMIRVTIGGSDFSLRQYTNDDRPSSTVADNSTTDRFRLVEEDSLYKIPMLKYILKQYGKEKSRELKLFGSMWSPPNWMKTNEHFNKGQLKPANQYFLALANLTKQFLLTYKNNSIDFWGLTVINEPIFAQQPFLDFNTMIFPLKAYSKYVSSFLGPMLMNDPKLSDIKIMAHDDNRRYLMNFTLPLLMDRGVSRYIHGVSVHGYVDQEYEMMNEIYDNGNVFVLPTELCSGHLPWMEKALIGNWHRGMHYALDIIRSLQHSAAGWVDWNMALDTRGGTGWLGGRLDSPVIVDKLEDAYYKSPMFYVLGQFSRFIPPGSIKLKDEIVNAEYDDHFETVTFLLQNSSGYVTVVVNNNPYQIDLQVRIENSNTYNFPCSPDSVTTFVYKTLE